MIKLQTREVPFKHNAKAAYMYVVSVEESLSVEDVCRLAKGYGVTVDYHTLLGAVNAFFRVERELVCEGKMVNTPNYHAQAAAYGTCGNAGGEWYEDANNFLEPRYTHTAEFKALLNKQRVQVVSERNLCPQLGSVFNYFTRTHCVKPTADNVVANVVTAQHTIAIHGKGLRLRSTVEGDLTVGVFFIAADDVAMEWRVDDRDVLHNMPSKLQLVVPDLPAAEYYIEVRTKSDTRGQTTIKSLRVGRFRHVVRVIMG